MNKNVFFHILWMINKFINNWIFKQNWKNVIRICFVQYSVSISLWCCKKNVHLDCHLNYFCLIWTHWKINIHSQYSSLHINSRGGFRVQNKVVTNFCKIDIIYITAIAYFFVVIAMIIVAAILIIVNIAITFCDLSMIIWLLLILSLKLYFGFIYIDHHYHFMFHSCNRYGVQKKKKKKKTGKKEKERNE